MRLRLVDRRAAPAPPPVAPARLAALVDQLGRPHWAVDLVLVDDAEMVAVNEQYHGGDGPTDVLSFSYLEDAIGAPGDLGKGEAGAARDLRLDDPDDEPLAGEIVLAPAFIAAACRREGWNEADEWAMLVVHAALHLLGWTHDDEPSRRRMRDREALELARGGWRHQLLDEETSR